MKIRRILPVCLITLLAPVVNAQESWNLKQCVEYAIEHNINVRQQILEKENQELNLKTTQYSRLPNLGASMGQDFYFGRGPGRDGTYEDQSQASTAFRVNTSVPVFSGLRIYNQIDAHKLDLQAAVEDLSKAKEDVALNITSYFLQVLFNKELLQIAQEQVRLSQEQVERATILVNNGKSPESELYDAKASLAKEELTLTEAANTLKLSLLNLSQLLNLETVEGFDVEMPDISQLIIAERVNILTPVDVFTASMNVRPSIRAAEFRLQSDEKNLKVAKADYYPSLSLGASYSNSYYHTYNLEEGSSNTPFGTQLRHNGSESVGLSLNIPVFNRMATKNKVRAARLSIENRQLLLDDAKQSLYKEIQQAYYNAVAAHKKFLSSEKSVEASKIAFRYEEEKYNAGKSTGYEYNDAKVRLEKSLSEGARAKYDFIFSSKILDFYNGDSLY